MSSSLIRALSWPLIAQSQVCNSPIPEEKFDKTCIQACNQNHRKKNGIPVSPTFQQLMAARRLLCRRYYPEGGWGWLIIIVGLLVHALEHGLQLSYGVMIKAVFDKFQRNSIESGNLKQEFQLSRH